VLLTATTDKLSLITSNGTCDINVVVVYTERNQSTGDVGATGSQETKITTATTTDILGAPGATTDRKVESISIRNGPSASSVSNDVTLQFNANGTLYEWHAARLRVTERLEWTLESGFTQTFRQDSSTYHKPVFERRMSSTFEESSQIVTGNFRNINTLNGCSVNVPRSGSANRDRVVVAFLNWMDLAGVATTGVGIGLLSPTTPFTSSGNPRIECCTTLVTDSVLSSNGGDVAVDQLVANGTSLAGAILGPGWLSGWVAWAELGAFEPPFNPMYIGLQSEVDASAVLVNKGAIFELFEATD